MSQPIEQRIVTGFTQQEGGSPSLIETLESRELQGIQEELRGKVQRGIIHIDRDRTLVDIRTGKTTDPRIADVIAKASGQGWLVCVSSLRPVGVLTDLTELGFDEPIIGENGAVFGFPSRGIEIITDESALVHATNIKNRLANFANTLNQQGVDVDIQRIHREPERLIEEQIIRGEWDNPKLAYALWINELRHTGVTVWPFMKPQQGQSPSKDEFFEVIRDMLKRYARQESIDPPFRFVEDRDNPVMILLSGRTTKTSAWETLFGLIGSESLEGKYFYHIGDASDDVIQHRDVHFAAVANVDPTIRESAIRVSEHPLTSGVVDNLEYILSHH